jgi:hypothetical protein
MNLRRQYSLPNCTLTLDGLEGDNPTDVILDNRPILSILINMDCFLVGQTQRLTGGRDLLENLVKSVNLYAQECLSGLSHPQEAVEKENQVKLEKAEESHLHRLTWYPEGSDQPQSVKMSMIQLFDLIEAVDQFVSDSYTLPTLSLTLQPLSRRHRQPDEPVAQRVIPATVGMLSLLIVASMGFLLPIPEVRQPTQEEVSPQPTPTETPSTPQPPQP